jgi:hypothetical protein
MSARTPSRRSRAVRRCIRSRSQARPWPHTPSPGRRTLRSRCRRPCKRDTNTVLGGNRRLCRTARANSNCYPSVVRRPCSHAQCPHGGLTNDGVDEARCIHGSHRLYATLPATRGWQDLHRHK